LVPNAYTEFLANFLEKAKIEGFNIVTSSLPSKCHTPKLINNGIINSEMIRRKQEHG
jgi:hypothetical protein